MTSEEDPRQARDRALVQCNAPINLAEVRRALKIPDYTARMILAGRRWILPSEALEEYERIERERRGSSSS